MIKYAAIGIPLSISMLGIVLDFVTTVIGLSRGFVETNPIYPYSLLITPAFYFGFLFFLDKVRVAMIPQTYSRYFVLFMCLVACIAFKGFVNNVFVLLAPAS